jgi:hypothetical protein
VTTGIRIAILVAALLVMLLVLLDRFDHHRRVTFRATCKSVRRGEAPDEIARSLEAAGGRDQGISASGRIWYLEGLISRRRGVCAVRFDATGAVSTTAWSERPK